MLKNKRVFNMEEDTLNILSEIEKKCQERGAENNEQTKDSDEQDDCAEGDETVAGNTHDHDMYTKSKAVNIDSPVSNDEQMLEEGHGSLNGDIGMDDIIVSTNSDSSDAQSEDENNHEETEMDVNDTVQTEDHGQKLPRVNGNLSDDHDDEGSDIVDIDINLNAERLNNDNDKKSEDGSVDATAESPGNSDTNSADKASGDVAEEATAESPGNSDTDSADNVQDDDAEDGSAEPDTLEGGDDDETEEVGTADSNGISTDGVTALSDDLNGSLRKPRKPKKRRKKWGKGWSPQAKYRNRSSSTIYSRSTSLNSTTDKSITADIPVDGDTEENEKTTGGAEPADTSQEGEAEGGSRPRKNAAREARISANNTDFIISDDLMDQLIEEPNYTPKFKKRKSLLFDHGKKIDAPKAAPLSPEDFERFSQPFKHGWQREIVVRGISTGLTSSGKPKSRPMDVYYRPPVGAKIRSMVQITEWLSKENTPLSGANFTFTRRPIGVKEGETIRQASASRGVNSARKRNRRDETQYHDDDNPLYDKPEVVIERDSEDYFAPIIAAGLGKDLPIVRFDTSCSSSPKKGRPRKHNFYDMKQEKVETMHPSNETVIVTPPKHSKFKATARKSTTMKPMRIIKQPIPYSGTESLCTLRCPGLEGMAPMLMCKKCMCLFHNECVNHFDDDLDFICLRCKDDQAKAAAATPTPLVLRVSMPMQMNQLDQSNITAMRTMPSNGTTNWSLPVASLIGPSFSVAGPHPSTQSSMLGTSASVSTISNLLSSKPMYQVIKPHVKVKDEPKDSSYDGSKVSVGNQASSEAIGSLKSKLGAARSSPGVSRDFSDQFAGQVSPSMSTPVSLRAVNRNSHVVRPGMSLMSTPPLQLGQNPNYRLVPIGPPVSLPNVPFQPIRLPGMNVQGLMPVGNMPRPLQKMPASLNSNFTTFGDLQKSSHTSTTKTGTNQSLNSMSNMVSMVQSQPSGTGESASCGGNHGARLVIDGTTIGAPETGQLLTLPAAVSKKLTLNKPLVLKIKNRQISVPPSGFFQARDGLKIFVPPNTFPTAEEELENSSQEDKEGGAGKTTSLSKTQSSGENVNTNSVVPCSKATGDMCRTRRYKKCCLIQRLYGGYDCMFHIFRFLNIKELMAVSLVCRTWKMISLHPSLWNDASFRGLRVSSWPKAMAFLKALSVSSISLLGMTAYSDLERTWNGFITSIEDIPTLQKVTFGIVPPIVLDTACLKLTHLQSLCAQCVSSEDAETMWTTPTRLDIGKFGSLSELRELRLKGVFGLTLPTFSLCGGISNLVSLANLETLSLTSLKNVEGSKFHFISELKNLRELALGECTSWTSETYAVLGEQMSLRKLRLEHGGEIPDTGLGEAVGKLKSLHTLELFTYTIAETFADHITQLPELRTLVIWPDNSSQPAQVNTNTLVSVRRLKSLERLKWVIQNGAANNSIILDDNDNSETVPKPEQEWIPFLSEKDGNQDAAEETRKTEYIGVRQLTEDLSALLPDTHINVFCVKGDQENPEKF